METHESFHLSRTALEHATQPKNNGPLAIHNGHAMVTGPCGDTMEFWLLLADDVVQKVSFVTSGCAPSHACGSIVTCLAQGKSLHDVSLIGQQDILSALGGLPKDFEHCALLASNTLKAACISYEQACKEKHSGQSAGLPQTSQEHEDMKENLQLRQRLSCIQHKIMVLSGKGGVGKSTVAVNLAVSLLQSGHRVGLLDVDIHGPSIPTMLGLEKQGLTTANGELIPVNMEGLKVISLGFLLQSKDDPVIWRGPRKMGVIKQFLKDVAWGELDFLVIDAPPGTGDEPLSICQLIEKVDGAVVVTTPQKVSTVDVRKSISFCRQLNTPILGLVENMSGFACPTCGDITQILGAGGAQEIAKDMHVMILGSIPLDPNIAQSCDQGRPFILHYGNSPTAQAMQRIIEKIKAEIAKQPQPINDNLLRSKENHCICESQSR